MLRCTGKRLLKLMREYDGEPLPKLVWERMKQWARNETMSDIIHVGNGIHFYKKGVMAYDPEVALPPDEHIKYAYFCFCSWVYDKLMALDVLSNLDIGSSAKTATDCICNLGNYYSNTTVPLSNSDYSGTYTVDTSISLSTPAYLTDEEAKYVRKMMQKDKENNNKENKNMFNFDFGKVVNSEVRFSTYGLAVKSVDGRYVAYDAQNKSVMDVDVLNMPAGEFLFKMPVAIKDIKIGDIVIHNRVPMFVLEKGTNDLTVIDIRESTKKTIMPVKSPFGFNFITKVVSLVDMGGANADNPFGNMWPLLMLNGNGKIEDIMPMLMMSNGMNMDMSNPMLMYFLMKDNKNMGDMALPMMMMAMQNNKPGLKAEPVVCECGQPIVH